MSFLLFPGGSQVGGAEAGEGGSAGNQDERNRKAAKGGMINYPLWPN